MIDRPEMDEVALLMGDKQLPLSMFRTTGFRMVAMGAGGSGKTNAGLNVVEQMVDSGHWVGVVVDPEGELVPLLGAAVPTPLDLREALIARAPSLLVVSADSPEAFVPYAEVISEVVDAQRKPVVLMIDEGQLFSNARKRTDGVGASSDYINDFVVRGRKRALDLVITTPRASASLNRMVFSGSNLTLIGAHADPSGWSMLAPLFKGAGVTYRDLLGLQTGEFIMTSPMGVTKVHMRMSRAFGAVARPAAPVQRELPASFREWDTALASISVERLEALSPAVVDLLCALSGLDDTKRADGQAALADELALR